MIKQYQTINYSLCWVWIVCLLLAGCSSSRSEQTIPEQSQATATPIFALAPTAPLDQSVADPNTTATSFASAENTTVTPATVASPTTLTNIPTSANLEESTSITTTTNNQVFLPVILHSFLELDTLAQPTQDERIAEIIIYDDQLAANWTAEQRYWVDYDLAATDYVYTGSTAIAITPSQRASKFFLAVESPPEAAYSRNEIIGVSFWLSGGANLVENDDLVVTVVGSNDYTYWVPDDTSVSELLENDPRDDLPLFSETRLYFLDINRPIPPDTWVEVIVWLDELIFDPPYNYVTGISLKNDEDFLQTYYIDRISFLLERE